MTALVNNILKIGDTKIVDVIELVKVIKSIGIPVKHVVTVAGQDEDEIVLDNKTSVIFNSGQKFGYVSIDKDGETLLSDPTDSLKELVGMIEYTFLK